MMPRNMLEAITAASANPAASQETGSESHENGGGEGRQARRYSQASRPPTFRGCLTIKSMGGVKTITVVKELSIDINGKRYVVRKRPLQTGKNCLEFHYILALLDVITSVDERAKNIIGDRE